MACLFLFLLIFQGKKAHVKIELETTLVPGYCKQCVGVDSDRFVFVFVANLTNGDHRRLNCGITGSHYYTSCTVVGQPVVMLVQCREHETTDGNHGQLQQPSSIVVSVNERAKTFQQIND